MLFLSASEEAAAPSFKAFPRSTGNLNSLLSIIVQCILFGLSMRGCFACFHRIHNFTNTWWKRMLLYLCFFLLSLAMFCFYKVWLENDIEFFLTLVEYASPCEVVEPLLKKTEEREFLSSMLSFSKKEETLDTLQAILLQLRKKTHRAMLFSGGPGLGKTELAKCLCRLNEKEGGYIVHIADIIRSGDKGIAILTDILKKAIKLNKLIVLDDGDFGIVNRTLSENLIVSVDEGDRKYVDNIRSVVNLLLSVLSLQFPVIFTVNFESNSDEAYSRRFGYHLQFFLPKRENVQQIWRKKYKKLTIAEENVIVQECIGLNGRDITYIILLLKREKRPSLKRALQIIATFKIYKKNRQYMDVVKIHNNFASEMNQSIYEEKFSS